MKCNLTAPLRYSNKATVWPSLIPRGKPFYIPANTRILYSVFVMHRSRDLWGPDGKPVVPLRKYIKYSLPHQPRSSTPIDSWTRGCTNISSRTRLFSYHSTPDLESVSANKYVLLPFPIRYDVGLLTCRSSRTTRFRSCSSACCNSFPLSNWSSARRILPRFLHQDGPNLAARTVKTGSASSRT